MFGENAVGSAASKANLMRDSGALLTLVGSIIHGDHEYWVCLLTNLKQHYKAPLQSRFSRYLTQGPNYHPHKIKILKYSPKTFRIGINVAFSLLNTTVNRRQKLSPNFDERRERGFLDIYCAERSSKTEQ